jgi:hypothetical protein
MVEYCNKMTEHISKITEHYIKKWLVQNIK